MASVASDHCQGRVSTDSNVASGDWADELSDLPTAREYSSAFHSYDLSLMLPTS